MIRLAALTATLLLTSAAFAGNNLQFAPFSGIDAHGGARVVLRHGAVQRVTIIKGDAGKADIHLRGKTLDVSACKNWCWNTSELVVEIVSPGIDDLEAHSGGSVDAQGNFPKQATLRAGANSGGAIDAEAIPAQAVNAKAHSGGFVRVKALSSIEAKAYAGGSVNYSGNPAQVSSSSYAGGSVSPH